MTGAAYDHEFVIRVADCLITVALLLVGVSIDIF